MVNSHGVYLKQTSAFSEAGLKGTNKNKTLQDQRHANLRSIHPTGHPSSQSSSIAKPHRQKPSPSNRNRKKMFFLDDYAETSTFNPA